MARPPKDLFDDEAWQKLYKQLADEILASAIPSDFLDSVNGNFRTGSGVFYVDWSKSKTRDTGTSTFNANAQEEERTRKVTWDSIFSKHPYHGDIIDAVAYDVEEVPQLPSGKDEQMSEQVQAKFTPGQAVEVDVRRWLGMVNKGKPKWKPATYIGPTTGAQAITSEGIYPEDALRATDQTKEAGDDPTQEENPA